MGGRTKKLKDGKQQFYRLKTSSGRGFRDLAKRRLVVLALIQSDQPERNNRGERQ
jgi:hypothetical protein